MTNTPTDTEIATLRSEFGITSNGRGIKEFTQVCDFARAVLAAGQATAAPAQEPYSGISPLETRAMLAAQEGKA